MLRHDAVIDLNQDSTLDEIMHLVEMRFGVAPAGWHRESARLFALDVALTVIRRNPSLVSESERHELATRLHEARSLVVGDRDDELGFIQSALATRLPTAKTALERHIWLTAIDALLPSPYRSALVSTRNALKLGATGTFNDVASLLRDRLAARLDEGSLTAEPPSGLSLTA